MEGKLEPKAAIGYLLQHVAQTVGQQSNQVLQEQLGLGMAQFRILLLLQEQPKLLQRQLADHLGQTEASISRQIKLLAEKGMLAVHNNPQSKREHVTALTPKGAKITEAAQDILLRYQDAMYQRLTEKQQKQLLDTLGTIHAWACQPGKFVACDHPYQI